jgi:transposase
MFVTMFYVVLDSCERAITYASAGHNPMVLYRGATGQTYFLNPTGFPVGIDLPDPEQFGRAIQHERVSLACDDLLVIYTDGITEAMNVQKEQYGMERFLEAIKRYATLAPSEFCTRLEQELADWTGDAPQSDDMTLVAIKERLATDDSRIEARRMEARQRLLAMVERDGLSVAEACRRAGVSTTTYYRLRRLRDEAGSEGLRVRRRRARLERLSHEDEVVLVELVREAPELGSKRLAKRLGERLGREVKPVRVAEALKRLGLSNRAARETFAAAGGRRAPRAA